MSNPVAKWQILSKNPESHEKFYSHLFGWKSDRDNSLGYTTLQTGKGGIDGGIWPIGPNEGQNMVQLFIQVGDVKEYFNKAKELGAHPIVPPQNLPDGDEMAILLDPQGLPFGIFKGGKTAEKK